MAKLFVVHLGFYGDLSDGVYESHTNTFIAAKDFADAKIKAKQLPFFRKNKMHIDGIQQIDSVMGFRVVLEKQDNDDTVVVNKTYKQISVLKNAKGKV